MMTKSSITALQSAATANYVGIAQILLDAGADVDAPFGSQTTRVTATEKQIDSHLVSLVKYAAYNDNVKMIQILLHFNANVDGYISVLAERPKTLDDVDLDEDDDDWLQTPLQLAVSHRNHILVRLLLLSGRMQTHSNMETSFCK
jgi:ankyrin repeat protein